jgi:hypothetical protein
MRCRSEGRAGYKWGASGVCFTGADARGRAVAVGRAVYARRNASKMQDTAEFRFAVSKVERAEGNVYGWAYQCERDGAQVIDHSGEYIPAEELRKAVIDFNLESRAGGEMHDPASRGRGQCIETVFFDREKWEAVGVAKAEAERLPVGWWVGFHFDPEDAIFQRAVAGERPMFSIGGSAEKVEVG